MIFFSSSSSFFLFSFHGLLEKQANQLFKLKGCPVQENDQIGKTHYAPVNYELNTAKQMKGFLTISQGK